MFSYIRIHSNEQNILNEFYRCVENRRSQHGMPIVEVAITIHGRTHHAMVDGGWLEASAKNNIYWRPPSYFAMQHWAARTLLNEAFVASNYFRTQCKLELSGTVEFDNKRRVLDGWLVGKPVEEEAPDGGIGGASGCAALWIVCVQPCDGAGRLELNYHWPAGVL